MKHYVIAYDIPDDDRRNKMSTLLAGYGERVQLSVFECWLNEAMLLELQERLLEAMDGSEDAVRIYQVAVGGVTTLGVGKPLEPPESYVI